MQFFIKEDVLNEMMPVYKNVVIFFFNILFVKHFKL